MHVFISVVSMSYMEVTFFNQNPCKPSRLLVFQFSIFLSVAWVSWGVCSSSSSITNSVRMLFIHSTFCYDLSVPIFSSKIILPLSKLVVDMASPIPSLLILDRIFPLFWNVFFWSMLFLVYVVRYIFRLQSFTCIFRLLVVVFFLSVIQVWVPTQV